MKIIQECSTIFFGKSYGEDYRDMVAYLVQSYKTRECNMSLKVHFLDSHLDFFQENLSGQWAVRTESDFTSILPRW